MKKLLILFSMLAFLASCASEEGASDDGGSSASTAEVGGAPAEAAAAPAPKPKATAPKPNTPFEVKVNGTARTVDMLTGATARANYVVHHQKPEAIATNGAFAFRVNGVNVDDKSVAYLKAGQGLEGMGDGWEAVSLTEAGWKTLFTAVKPAGITVDDVLKVAKTYERDIAAKTNDSQHGSEMFAFKGNIAVSKPASGATFQYGRAMPKGGEAEVDPTRTYDDFPFEKLVVVPITAIQAKVAPKLTKGLTDKNAIVADFSKAVTAAAAEAAAAATAAQTFNVTQKGENMDVPFQLRTLDMNKKFHYNKISLEEREKLPGE